MIHSPQRKIQGIRKDTKRLLYAAIFIGQLCSCSVSKQIGQHAQQLLAEDTVIATGHLGISIFDATADRYVFNYNAEKYFLPASNVKLFTLYAGLKHLGDSLIGLRYHFSGEHDSAAVLIRPCADPTFLAPGFSRQPVYDFLKRQQKAICYIPPVEAFGPGWAWDDYLEPFMPVRSAFPLYKNQVLLQWISKDSLEITPSFFANRFHKPGPCDSGFRVEPAPGLGELQVLPGNTRSLLIPFDQHFDQLEALLKDTLPNLVLNEAVDLPLQEYQVLYSRPVDEVLVPMMHNSDNFFAEQLLLMVSDAVLGRLNDAAIIDTLLATDLLNIPQRPRWVDGSGLSRYNLFTPQSFVYLLRKMKNEFGWERMTKLLPTGGEGTLAGYYTADSGYIYAKTGSMGNQVTLAGYLLTRHNRTLIFSIMVNNEMGNAGHVRRSIEQFLTSLRERY